MLLGFGIGLVATEREVCNTCIPAALFGAGFGMVAATF